MTSGKLAVLASAARSGDAERHVSLADGLRADYPTLVAVLQSLPLGAGRPPVPEPGSPRGADPDQRGCGTGPQLGRGVKVVGSRTVRGSPPPSRSSRSSAA